MRVLILVIFSIAIGGIQALSKPKKCPKNEIFKKCGEHSSCEPTCFPTPLFCPAVCVTGCFCQEDYVRSENRTCIPKSSCPKPECKANEVYGPCGNNPCEATCENPQLPTMCKAPCSAGCGCKEGFVRDSDGNCVALDECPKPVCEQENEVYNDCGQTAGCEPSCERPNGMFLCPDVCVKGCFCKDGYVRGTDGKCILVSDCPKKACPQNETWVTCSGFCYEKSCSQLGEPVAVCDPGPFCTPGCVCEDGYYRNDDNQCVAPPDCKEQQCLENQVWSQCDKFCDRRCSHITHPILDCFMMGCNPGCICADGYYRNENDFCIPRNSCPEANETSDPQDK